MKIKTVLCLLGLAVIVSGFASSMAMAEQNVPGSLLIWPYIDTRDGDVFPPTPDNSGTSTIVTVTNTYLTNWKVDKIKDVLAPGHETCDTDPNLTFGETGVYFIFFDSEDCREHDFQISLSAQDTASFVIRDKIQDDEVGWMVAFAYDYRDDPRDPRPWSFDFLVGNAHVVNAPFDLSWTYNAYAFLSSHWNDPLSERSIVGGNDVYTATTPACGKHYLDVDNNDDGILDFDQAEYEEWPDEMLLPRFFEEANNGEDYSSLLSVISPSNTIEEQQQYQTTASILFWNNDENENGFPYSKTFNFECQFVDSLYNISAQFEQLGGIAEEQPTGWAIFDGYLYRQPDGTIENYDPPLLGVFAQFNNYLADPTDEAQHAGGNNFFTRGFNDPKAQIQYRFGQPIPR
jgi:hypothetical protein